jgi:hypothetical protein
MFLKKGAMFLKFHADLFLGEEKFFIRYAIPLKN